MIVKASKMNSSCPVNRVRVWQRQGHPSIGQDRMPLFMDRVSGNGW